MIILLFTNNNINLLTGIFKCKYKNKIFFRCYNYILLFLLQIKFNNLFINLFIYLFK